MMALLRWFDRFPGGRALFIALPILLFLVGAFVLGSDVFIQVDNAVILTISVACLVPWRRSLGIFFGERQSASAIWFSLGVFGIIVTTIINTAYSTYLRATDVPVSNTIVAALRFTYALELSCLFLAPQARSTEVPPAGWLTLLALVALASTAALLGIWLF